MLLFNNVDKPGIVGRVTAVLSDYNVNIASLAVSRQASGLPALSLVTADQRIPAEAAAKIAAQDGITNVRTASFNDDFVPQAAAASPAAEA